MFLSGPENLERVNKIENIAEIFEEMEKKTLDSENQPYYLVARIDAFLEKFDLENLINQLIKKLNELTVNQTTLKNRYQDLIEEVGIIL